MKSKIWIAQVNDWGKWKTIREFPKGTTFIEADDWLREWVRSTHGWISGYRITGK